MEKKVQRAYKEYVSTLKILVENIANECNIAIANKYYNLLKKKEGNVYAFNKVITVLIREIRRNPEFGENAVGLLYIFIAQAEDWHQRWCELKRKQERMMNEIGMR